VKTSIIVFAKAPVAGFAKTRLIPALGAAGAALLAERMLAHAVREAVLAALGPVELCVTPDFGHPALWAIAQTFDTTIAAQGPGDLGARMHRAFVRHLQAHQQALLLGCDAPAVNAARLIEAADALRSGGPVFIPALDGGYALIGQKHPDLRLFAAMHWGHAAVMEDTRIRMRAAGIAWQELAPVADIDEPADLVHLPAGWVTARSVCPPPA
jgi:rSAM/selenodomain-associated transferase 1